MKIIISNRERYATQMVQGFSENISSFKTWMLINTFSSNTAINYVRKLSDLALHFNKLPESICEAELAVYFEKLILEEKGSSQSSFKHTVYGLKLYLRSKGQKLTFIPNENLFFTERIILFQWESRGYVF